MAKTNEKTDTTIEAKSAPIKQKIVEKTEPIKKEVETKKTAPEKIDEPVKSPPKSVSTATIDISQVKILAKDLELKIKTKQNLMWVWDPKTFENTKDVKHYDSLSTEFLSRVDTLKDLIAGRTIINGDYTITNF